MHLSDEEKAMLNGEFGKAKKWAIDHQIKVGEFFDAKDMVAVSQAHMMADPESVGDAGVDFMESIATAGGRVVIPMITDPRGVDLNHYRPLGQTEDMAMIERRFIAACETIGIMMTNTCVNYQTIMPPLLGDHVAYGDTGVVIYSNSVCGARSNFEGGPSALAAGLTGRTPRYGLHLDQNRKATRRFQATSQPTELTEWGILGAVIGRLAGSYWEVPVIEGIERVPTSDEIKHFGAAMASYGSIPLFHIIGITPEAPNLAAVSATELPVTKITDADLEALAGNFADKGEKPDVVVFAAPQLSIVEMEQVASLVNGQRLKLPMIVCTSPQAYGDARRMGFIDKIETAGGTVLEGTCFYNQYAREIGEANGWVRLLSNSAKIVNILGGYGYQPVLASMADCVAAAIHGEIVK
ncbi:MAG: aconitase X catalytic domain-containing protein [Proteobacteria bacterium]|nr:aconitase X catalytic domain-containing protein [Pseudomonadota bacterium]MDA0959980.1 aconitase X catalytic domain-containing protein [Pseudomonadota bacterium]MDA1152270.1 aconitase X catalytic domain-containing protein [Pseudomonadota bacterium]